MLRGYDQIDRQVDRIYEQIRKIEERKQEIQERVGKWSDNREERKVEYEYEMATGDAEVESLKLKASLLMKNAMAIIEKRYPARRRPSS